ncbi:MAG: hypothetical protein E6H92_03300 [Chloroflexi bacterium]|nr:MAG: hypothetical protein E6H92_03300 [Chloroflexota bacterium]
MKEETAGLPQANRRELLADVSSHVEEARRQLTDETDADILNILDRLGEPSAVAADAAERFGISRAPAVQPEVIRPGIVEIGALVLTPLLWPIGVILLWASPAWNTRDKLIGTLVPPGGYWGIGIFAAMFATAQSCNGSFSIRTCAAGGPGWLPIVPRVAALFVFLLPLVSMAYLSIRLRARSSLQRT